MNPYYVLAFVILAAVSTDADSGNITCIENEECAGMVPPPCFNESAINVTEECTTCCCTSSSNVEFYDETEGEPNCTAPDATYRVTLVGTWTQTCHPDNYSSASIWSPLTGISHKPTYELWNACMCDVSPGVALVSQTGNTTLIKLEYEDNQEYIYDSFAANEPSSAGGNTSQELNISSGYQYVSVVTMLAPSEDRMIGVSLLQLCNGSEWKSSVKLCAELFSTATKTERVSEGRNSVQDEHCSFGHFEFTLLSTAESAGEMVTSHLILTVVVLAVAHHFLR